MTYEQVIALAMLVSLVLYGLSAGADFGGGVWDLLARGPRAHAQRQAIERAIAPIWEANHVWLILVIVLMFTAFPPAFGAIMTALHIPMTLVLIGIVLRASAFVIRKYDVRSDALHRRWSLLFGVSSLLTPFFLGLSLGALGSGEIRVIDGTVTSGFFAGWTRPFAASVGIFAQALFAFLAATYLTADAETDAGLRDDFRARALASGIALAPAAALVFMLSRAGATVIFEGLTEWWAPLLLAATSSCAIGALLALWLRRYALARLAAAGQVALILIGWGLAQYPHILVPDLTFQNTATAPRTLRFLIQALTGGAILLLPCFVLLYRVFKGSRAGRGYQPGD